MREIDNIIIASSPYSTIEETRQYDLRCNCNNILGHYFIDEEGNILDCLDHSITLCCENKLFRKSIFIRIYIKDRESGSIFGNLKEKQIRSTYALLYTLYTKYGNYTIYNGSLIGEQYDTKMYFNLCFNNLEILFKMCDNSTKKFREIKEDIRLTREEAQEAINKGLFKCKEDVLKSKYYNLYNVGIKRYKNIINTHINNPKELIEIRPEKHLFIHNEYIHISVYEDIIKRCKQCNIEPWMMFETLYRETSYIKGNNGVLNDKILVHKNGKKYIPIINAFKCWSLIKETYPSSKTINVIKKLQDKQNLTKEELIDFLTAYMLLSKEARTIKDYDSNKIMELIYEKIINGIYICGENYVNNGHQINMRNLFYFFFGINLKHPLELNDY